MYLDYNKHPDPKKRTKKYQNPFAKPDYWEKKCENIKSLENFNSMKSQLSNIDRLAEMREESIRCGVVGQTSIPISDNYVRNALKNSSQTDEDNSDYTDSNFMYLKSIEAKLCQLKKLHKDDDDDAETTQRHRSIDKRSKGRANNMVDDLMTNRTTGKEIIDEYSEDYKNEKIKAEDRRRSNIEKKKRASGASAKNRVSFQKNQDDERVEADEKVEAEEE